MSQDQTVDQDQQDAGSEVEATLEFGETYTYKGIVFTRGQPQIISREDAEYLAETAVDTITVSRGGEKTNSTQPKFLFKDVAGSAAPKARPRAARAPRG